MVRLGAIIVSVVIAAILLFSYTRKKNEHAGKPTIDTLTRGTDSISTNADRPEDLRIFQTKNPYWQQLLTDYADYLQQSLDKNMAPGVAVAVVRDSSVLYAKGLGFRDASTHEPIGLHSLFRLGSVSKSLAAVLTGILVQEHTLRWNDKVIKYVPSFKLKSRAATDSLTIAHLLSHTTGLPYHAYTDRVDDGANFDTLVYHLRDLNLIGPPGEVYSYQNVAFSVISKVIEAATGRSYEEVMKEKLFTPLNMAQASLNFQAMTSTLDKARPHQYGRKQWRPMAISHTYYNVGPAGGVNASISDMARWLRALTNTRDTVIDQTTKDDIFKPAVKAIARNRNFRKWKRSTGSYYAMGWRVLTFKDDTVNYHGGYVNGFRSEVAIKRDDQIGICVLVNSAGSLADHAVPEFFRMYEKYRVNILKWDQENSTKLIARNK
jgi:beta-lactamase class C